MAGIYLHVPYCKVKCHYCDFHFSTQHNSMERMVQAMRTELKQRASYLEKDSVSTIYFGGGTPSLFSAGQIETLIADIHDLFNVEKDVEVTLECNPDDLTADSLEGFKKAGINRLSIGIQSFDEEVLKFMNRAHNAHQAMHCVELAKQAGFENITIDLIYGIPGKGLEYWKQQLDQFAKLNLPHLSSYCLTIEPKTFFGQQHKAGLLSAASDEASLEQFQYMMDFVRARGFEHYEISNFAREGYISKHNSAYWLGKRYLGIGPSAHSYNLLKRGWNIANNAVYIEKALNDVSTLEEEQLGISERCNDYLMTRLRTKWGVELGFLDFISITQKQDLEKKLYDFEKAGLVVLNGSGAWILTDTGKYRADGIAADLFI